MVEYRGLSMHELVNVDLEAKKEYLDSLGYGYDVETMLDEDIEETFLQLCC